ncbi:DPP IV N-terminal domain-containing protein [Novosphingobium aerophilum]|uniref:DPP IV N-terminal domain-containing protein n=1 Tax=Novosphingobium TaxID=165696 RepID=UPI00104D424C|nr:MULTISPECIES: DPP IV N-terminal domain-containing protein [unclassified Novosphingobium]MPS70483.1 S9 family peptidase [Novosphingobium sp.]TCM34392.1 dipeptidyl aminopeptidase/acylaminoacyl peptidase [Novosphingobium sp. ST904]
MSSLARAPRFIGIAAVCAAILSSAGALAAPGRADIDRSIALRENWQYLTRDVAWPAHWTPDGAAFSYRKTVEGGFAFETVDARTLARSPAFDQQRLAAALTAALGRPVQALRLPFADFDYAGDRQTIQFWLDEDGWRCTLADYVCGKQEDPRRPRGFGVVRDLSIPADNHPRLSPDGKWEATVEDDNLVLRAAGTTQAVRLSTDGSAGNFYDPETIAWSPDSRHLMIYRVRPGYARHVLRVEAAPEGKGQPGLRTQLYPKPGDAVDQEQPVLFDVADRRQTVVDPALFPNAYELSGPRWRADGRSVEFDYVRRGFGQARIVSVDAASGAAHAAVTEDAKTFVYADRRYSHDVKGLGNEIVWASERDGWNHLYLIDGRTGKVKNRITTGQWVVREVVRVDDEKRRIWFVASGMNAGEDPYFRHYYSIDFDGRNLTPLTPERADHTVSFSPDMQFFVDTYSRVDLPNVSELHRTADGALVQTIAKGDISRLTAAGFRAPEVFTAKGRDGKTDIWGLVVRPRDYDPAKKYPVIENIYAGPHDSFVPKSFWPFGYHSGGDKVIGMQALADLGFIVVQIDGMGTANRSKAFQDVAWKNLQDSGFPDRILWHKALAAKDPAYDIGRVGIYGASAGGQSTLNALLFHGDFYKAGVAMAGCYDNRMDKISWNEQWLGWPVDKSYADASGVDNAARLQGKLFMIVGEQDSNVDPASTMQVADALIKADKDFDLLVVPGGEHSVGRSTGPIDYVTRRLSEFFVRSLQD